MYFTYPGKTLSTPKWVTIAFIYTTNGSSEYIDHTLSAEVDNQIIALGTMEVLKSRTIKGDHRNPSVAIEVLELPLPYRQFLILANARKIKMRLNKRDFDLDKKDLEALKDLASRTVP
jgi:hypothetical protein